ncbi:hypothetical protein D0962_25725 [Leptolyngbyaceae cyanobacterium CCMR0082]|uniref:NB-ARC domain-containing protein n=1 Tax=Adonisia turfae CCMR0082 TaxID=2304604 RepID=A0A6M0SCB4_9CYAN|nr:tetratricopeptide repeat protein [Adonisia turfae]NEZ66120.1 hypothetical protein [Adonisia turfae CCMR0082]
MPNSKLYDLLYQCSVKLSLPDGTCGTGFFVAPGYLLTCEHVVRHANNSPIQVRWQQQDNFAKAYVEEAFEEYDIALLRFVSPSEDLPCVYLSDELDVGDEIYLFGYPDTEYENGRPVTPKFEGFTGDFPPFIMLEQGQLQPGMSGAALLNQSTGKVCGMLKFTRDKFTDMGGGGIKTAVILQQFPNLVQLQKEFHQRDNRWQNHLGPSNIPPQKPLLCPNNLPRSGTVKFVGRESEFTTLHTQLYHAGRSSLTAIQGMGGVGKTELALQYARYHLSQQTYSAGICWFQAKEQNVGAEIVNFAEAQLGLEPLKNLDLHDQVQFCWRNWPIPGNILIIIDDVTDYATIKPYLPPQESRFVVLLTTRLQLGASIHTLLIDLLSQEASLDLISSLIGSERVTGDIEAAQALCHWLGYLPLGLELVGRFLIRKPDWTLSKMRQKLKEQCLDARALNKHEADMTAIHKSAAAAFELSWQTLNKDEQKLAYHLSLFALAPIPWSFIEAWSGEDEDDLEDWRDDGLINRSLLTRVGRGRYQLHQLVREYFRSKLDNWPEANKVKQNFCQNMAQIAQEVPQIPTREQISNIAPAIPHLAEVATTWLGSLNDENLIWPFVGLGRFYEGQGFYREARTWYENCDRVVNHKLQGSPQIIASIQGHLARMFQFQGQYVESEKLYEQILETQKKYLHETSPDIAETLNDLGVALYNQGKYNEAEQILDKALESLIKTYGECHPKVVEAKSNLAMLLSSQGKYLEAEKLFIQALEIGKQCLGEQHPRVATYMGNLALFYKSQDEVEKAEPLYVEALTRYRKLLGEEHPSLAEALNNLGMLYIRQENYSASEELLTEALEIQQKIYGEEHPNVATGINNIAYLYDFQNRFGEAEQLYIKALEMRRQLLGEEHPQVAISLNNLAKLYSLTSRYSDAKNLYQKALEILKSSLGGNHPLTIRVEDNLTKLTTAIQK